MGLTDFAGIFSRAFVVGYFVPWFFGIFVLRLLVADETLPAQYTQQSGATEVLIIGAIAILAGLLLSGLNRSVIRLLEGYPLLTPLGGKLVNRRREKYRRDFDTLKAAKDVEGDSDAKSAAALEFYTRFPARRASVLPTKFGNVLRSFETHPRDRYGLDGITFWPRVELLLEDGEREVITDAQTNLNFFVNGMVALLGVGAGLIVDRAAQAETDIESAWQIAIVVAAVSVGCTFAYKMAIDAAAGWGDLVRAAFDIHRREAYEKMGVVCTDDPAEDMKIGRAVTRCLLFAEPVPKRFRVPPDPPAAGAKKDRPTFFEQLFGAG